MDFNVSVALTSAIALWHKIVDWAQDSLFPWLEENMNFISEQVKDAFLWLDQKVAVPIRNAVKRAWETLRDYLLKMVTTFERRNSNEWIRKTTSWIITKLTPAPSIRKVTEETVMNWDELPPDVREAALRKGQQEYDINVTELRDKEIQEMELSN